MGARGGGNDDEAITDINVTPFVDVVLVLLIIFMLAAPVVYQSAVRVQLPKAVSGETVDKVTLRFYITADGKMTLEKEAVTAEQVGQKVALALKHDPLADAIVAADMSVTHGKVMELIDQIKANGIRQVAIGVDVKSGSTVKH